MSSNEMNSHFRSLSELPVKGTILRSHLVRGFRLGPDQPITSPGSGVDEVPFRTLLGNVGQVMMGIPILLEGAREFDLSALIECSW